MIILVILLALPLCLRWLVAWRMRQAQVAVRRGEDECRALKTELHGILEEAHNLHHLERQYRDRKNRLVGDISTMRSELAELRTKETRRIAA